MSARPRCPAAALLTALCLLCVCATVMAAPPARAAGHLVARFTSLGSQARPGPLLFGAHTDGAVYDGSVAGIDALQRRLDRRIGIVNWYQNWSVSPGRDWISTLHPELIDAVAESRRLPLLTWEPWDPAAGARQPRYRLRRIAGGAFDAYIRQWARGLRDAGSTVYLRPMHEFNGDWYPWGGTVNGNSARDYRAAWRHLHDVFEREGATNVRWVWCAATADAPARPGNRMERYYPGRRYVDVLALDGYNWGSTRPEYGGWQSFREVFCGAYRRLKALGDQPIWVAEVGSAPEGGSKARWVRGMFATAARWRRLKAIVWFDLDKERDWRASPVASAFRARR